MGSLDPIRFKVENDFRMQPMVVGWVWQGLLRGWKPFEKKSLVIVDGIGLLAELDSPQK